MPDFRASYIPINFYQLIVGDVAQLIPSFNQWPDPDCADDDDEEVS
jgi:hypothetical protein